MSHNGNWLSSRIFYKKQVRSCVEYCSHLCDGSAKYLLDVIDRLQRRALIIIGDDEVSYTLNITVVYTIIVIVSSNTQSSNIRNCISRPYRLNNFVSDRVVCKKLRFVCTAFECYKSNSRGPFWNHSLQISFNLHNTRGKGDRNHRFWRFKIRFRYLGDRFL